MSRSPHASYPEDLTDALAFALRFNGGKRVRGADEIMSEIVAKRLVEHLARVGFVVMKRPPMGKCAPQGTNSVGALFLFGFYYRLNPSIEENRFALPHVWIWIAATIIMAIGCGLVHTGHEGAEPIAAVGSLIIFADAL